MTWSLVQSRSASFGATEAATLAFLSNVTAGNLIVVALTAGTPTDGDLTSITDGLANTYNTLPAGGFQADTGNNQGLWVRYAKDIAGGACTITCNGANITAVGFKRLAIHEYHWDGAEAIDVDVSAGQFDTTGSSGADADVSTPATTTENGDLIFGAVMETSLGTATWTAGATPITFTERQEINQFQTQDGVQSAAGSVESRWTCSNTGQYLAIMAAFKVTVADSAALTGTATANIVKADVVAGGKTAIATLTGETFVPAQTISDISFIANALGGTTTTTSFSITLPATQAGDIIVLEFAHRGTGDGTIGGTYTGPAFTLKHSQLFASSAFSGKTYWSRATGDHVGETVTGADLTNSSAAIITIYRGTAASGDPLADATIVGEENASGNETQAEITTATDKAWVVLVVVNSPDLAIATQACTSPGTLTERAERLSTGGTDSSIAHASAVKASAGATGALTWTQTNGASGSWAYAIKPNVTTPFADARAAIRDGLDSAQSEAAGWDAKVKPNIPLANIVRTSDTVCTVTLQAQADYDISAQETITWTLPGSALTGGSPIVATPTFTVDVAGAEPRRVPVRNVSQAVNRASTY